MQTDKQLRMFRSKEEKKKTKICLPSDFVCGKSQSVLRRPFNFGKCVICVAMRPQFPLWLEVTTSLSGGGCGVGELRRSQSIGNYFVELTGVTEGFDLAGEGPRGTFAVASLCPGR